MGSHWHRLQSNPEFVEPPDPSGVTNLQQPTALQVDHAEWPDLHSQLDLRPIPRPRMVGNHRELPDGRRLQADSLQGVCGQVELHLQLNFTCNCCSSALALTIRAVQVYWTARRVESQTPTSYFQSIGYSVV